MKKYLHSESLGCNSNIDYLQYGNKKYTRITYNELPLFLNIVIDWQLADFSMMLNDTIRKELEEEFHNMNRRNKLNRITK